MHAPRRMVEGENLEFSAAQTSSLDQWWCQQLSRDQFLNKKRRSMHHDSDGGQCYSARRGVMGRGKLLTCLSLCAKSPVKKTGKVLDWS